MTQQQFEVLDAVERFIRENGCAPTWSSLSDITGVRRTTLRERAVRLVRAGYLVNNPGAHRSLSISASGKRAVRIHRSTTAS